MRHHAWLYSAVFTGRFSALLVGMLYMSFLIQPLHKAYASEPILLLEETEQVQVEDVVFQSTPTTDSSPINDTFEDAPSESETPLLATTSPPEEVSPDEIVIPIDSDSNLEDTATSSSEPESVSPETVSETIETPTTGEVVELGYVVTEENYYQFSKHACIAVGDGAFHCSTNAKTELDAQSVAYAEAGESGNMEIFLKTTRGTVRQITNNTFDDTAPHYDPESMRVVWQRLIDGRYQIILYDIMEEKETQLTFSKTNNMEPKVSEAGIVWQAWDNNDWEIMYFDGTYTEQLTANESQDVAPVIQDGYILWSVLGLENQEAKVYSLDTKETVTISGHDGGSITNPRFVLVYDTEFDNGDTVTQSFDPATGLSEPVASRPVPAPIDIPESDPTGEIRALLTQGKNHKDEGEFDGGLDDIGGPLVPVDTASTTNETLNLKAPDSEQTVVVPGVTVGDFELTEYDLVIPRLSYEEQ